MGMASDPYESALKQVVNSPNMYREGVRRGLDAEIRCEGVKRVMVVGVGGSGIVGDIVAALLEGYEVFVHKGFDIPGYVGRETLMLAVSYSGETAETLRAVSQALGRGMNVVGVSTGGRLLNLLGWRNVVSVSTGFEPRFAVPEMTGVVYGLLCRVYGIDAGSFIESVKALEDYLRGVEVSGFSDIAESLVNRTAVCVTHGHLRPAGLRHKAQLNENAKHPAYCVEFPEACHNEVEGWTNLSRFAYLLLRSRFEDPLVKEAFEWSVEYLSGRGGLFHEVVVGGESRAEELLKHLAFADLLSIFLARRKDVNPFTLTTIPLLRPRIRKHGPKLPQ